MKRRDFVKVTGAAAAGLVVAFSIPGVRRFAGELAEGDVTAFAPNAWLTLDGGGVVTVVVDEGEMGQGVRTALPMILAEELEADWRRVRVAPPPADPSAWPRSVSTGGSSSVRTAWEPLRKAGAAAREMLREAAARRWDVEVDGCRAERGAIVHEASGRRLGYGELVEEAARLPVPEDPPLKSTSDFRLVGSSPRRVTLPGKVDGSAVYGLDVRRPGMRFATVARCPTFGGTVSEYDATAALAVPGVERVVEIGSGVAVVAVDTWAAQRGRDVLDVTWERGAAEGVDSESVRRSLETLARQPGVSARSDGDAREALARARGSRRRDAIYRTPFLAHATMEPMNCTAEVRPDGVEVWAPTQAAGGAQEAAAEAADVPVESVRVHSTLMGGGFGRRSETDFVREAVEISRDTGAPVQVVWTREDDIRHDYYRPASLHRLSAVLDGEGWPVAWFQRIVAPSILARWAGPESLPNGLDREAVAGAVELPYAIPELEVEYVRAELGVPVGWWRSVNHSFNAFATECFLDELAAAARKNPYDYRRRLLGDEPRHLAVLDRAAEAAGWGGQRSAGRFRGIALHRSFGTYVAEVAEVSLDREGAARVHRVVCAVDCGTVVHPDIVRAQMEGGIVYGLTAALYGSLAVERGGVVEGNFDTYRMLRMDRMPEIDVHILESDAPPSGVGEPGTPPIAPAVVNALFPATGRRIRELPIPAPVPLPA